MTVEIVGEQKFSDCNRGKWIPKCWSHFFQEDILVLVFLLHCCKYNNNYLLRELVW